MQFRKRIRDFRAARGYEKIGLVRSAIGEINLHRLPFVLAEIGAVVRATVIPVKAGFHSGFLEKLKGKCKKN